MIEKPEQKPPTAEESYVLDIPYEEKRIYKDKFQYLPQAVAVGYFVLLYAITSCWSQYNYTYWYNTHAALREVLTILSSAMWLGLVVGLTAFVLKPFLTLFKTSHVQLDNEGVSLRRCGVLRFKTLKWEDIRLVLAVHSQGLVCEQTDIFFAVTDRYAFAKTREKRIRVQLEGITDERDRIRLKKFICERVDPDKVDISCRELRTTKRIRRTSLVDDQTVVLKHRKLLAKSLNDRKFRYWPALFCMLYILAHMLFGSVINQFWWHAFWGESFRYDYYTPDNYRSFLEQQTMLHYARLAPLAIVIGGAALAAFLRIVYIMLQPAQLRFAEEGLVLRWRVLRHWFESAPIAWKNIKHVALNKQWRLQPGLQFTVRNSITMRTALESVPGFCATSVMAVHHLDNFSVPLAAIDRAADKLKLARLLNQNLSPDRLDVRAIDALAPSVNSASYTTLWQKALQSASRVRMEPLAPGTILIEGPYEIRGPIGGGGQGVAYLANNPEDRLDKVVLKEFILPSDSAVLQRRALSNIEREAQLLKRIAHPNIVSYVDCFFEDHRAYLVLEHIEGLNLRQFVEQSGPLPSATVLKIGAQLCDILSYLHGLSPPVVHRDFTPENLIVRPDGVIKLIDFNVAQQLESSSSKTVVGKHAYIPPEQFRGRATVQSDLYALGATLHFLLTGHDPEPISISHPRKMVPSVSPELDGVVAKATEPEAISRYASASAIGAHLSRLAESTYARPTPEAVVGAQQAPDAVIKIPQLVEDPWGS